ncbi:hypothetical protein BDR06DRAFT_395009 [Suillus hirtellus]|nr:hypothetical protein BDR06DRAFT_395009 [Suillus hirtellus]
MAIVDSRTMSPYRSFETLLWHDVMRRLSHLAPLFVSGCRQWSCNVSVLFVLLFDVSHLLAIAPYGGFELLLWHGMAGDCHTYLCLLPE